MPKITFSSVGKTVEADDGTWMYDVCDEAGSGIPFACKAGACGTCATEVLNGGESLGTPGARELRTLETKGLDPAKFRLPCLADVHGDVVFGASAGAAESGASLPIHDVVVESYRPLNLTVAEIRFYVESDGFAFRPGQYMILHAPGGEQVVRRSYSISTPPSDRRHFEICVRAVSGGFGSNFVHRLRPGDRLKVEGPYGDFVLHEESRRAILMIATGTGMSPIKSMLLHLLDTRSRRKVRLFFGLRSDADLFYTDLLRGLSAHYPEFSHEIILSAPDPTRWAGPRGRVTDLITDRFDPRDAESTEAYICGGRDMIECSRQLLLEKGLPASAIYHENFY